MRITKTNIDNNMWIAQLETSFVYEAGEPIEEKDLVALSDGKAVRYTAGADVIGIAFHSVNVGDKIGVMKKGKVYLDSTDYETRPYFLEIREDLAKYGIYFVSDTNEMEVR